MNRRILVVDDDPAVRSAFRLAVEDLDVNLTAVGSGNGLLHEAAADDIAMIFLDLKMPDLDGIATLRRLRTAGCDATVFVVTGFAEEFMEGLRAAAAEGLNFEVMRKPMRREEIRAVVATVLAEGT